MDFFFFFKEMHLISTVLRAEFGDRLQGSTCGKSHMANTQVSTYVFISSVICRATSACNSYHCFKRLFLWNVKSNSLKANDVRNQSHWVTLSILKNAEKSDCRFNNHRMWHQATNSPFYLPHSTQSDKCLNSLSCSAFIFLQLSCKIIAMIIKRPYNTLYIQSVLQSFISQSTSFCKSSFIMSYVSLRTVFYMIRLTGDISILEAKVALYSICIPVIYLCPLTFVQPKHVVFVLSGARRILE